MRLFVAAELPAGVVERLAAWTPRHDALRPVAPSALHLTLAFLGERPSDGGLAGLLEPLARPVGELSAASAPLWLPVRRPRALAVGVEDPSGALRALQADVSEALERSAGLAPADRPYLPHVTVARVRRGARAPRLELAPPALEPFAATALTLFRSHLGGRGGARYETLASVALV